MPFRGQTFVCSSHTQTLALSRKNSPLNENHAYHYYSWRWSGSRQILWSRECRSWFAARERTSEYSVQRQLPCQAYLLSCHLRALWPMASEAHERLPSKWHSPFTVGYGLLNVISLNHSLKCNDQRSTLNGYYLFLASSFGLTLLELMAFVVTGFWPVSFVFHCSIDTVTLSTIHTASDDQVPLAPWQFVSLSVILPKIASQNIL